MSIAEKLTTIAENEQKVYDAGKKAEYDAFWDNYQDNGKRTDYANGFTGYGKGWNNNNFYPKYNMKPTKCASMFYAWEDATIQTLDLLQRFKECNVEFDTSKATQANQCFAYSKFTALPAIDLTSVSGIVSKLYYGCPYLETIEKIKIHENIGIDGWFYNNRDLVKLTIEGTIGQNGFNVQWSTKLSKESIVSILTALKDDGEPLHTITLSKVAVDKAFETSPGANDGSESQEWYAITNIGGAYWWTISLV